MKKEKGGERITFYIRLKICEMGHFFSGGRDFFVQMNNSIEYYIHKKIPKGFREICSFLKLWLFKVFSSSLVINFFLLICYKDFADFFAFLFLMSILQEKNYNNVA